MLDRVCRVELIAFLTSVSVVVYGEMPGTLVLAAPNTVTFRGGIVIIDSRGPGIRLLQPALPERNYNNAAYEQAWLYTEIPLTVRAEAMDLTASLRYASHHDG